MADYLKNVSTEDCQLSAPKRRLLRQILSPLKAEPPANRKSGSSKRLRWPLPGFRFAIYQPDADELVLTIPYQAAENRLL